MFELRPWRMEDVKGLPQHANNLNIAQFMTNGFPHPYDEIDAAKFVKMAMEHPVSVFMAIEVDGEAVGGIGLHPKSDIYEKNAELGYWLSEAYWGRGIMTQAILEMVNYGFRHLNIERIFAITFGTNEASKKVLEKSGFEFEAVLKNTIFKNGSYFDEYIYAIRRGQHAGELVSSSSK